MQDETKCNSNPSSPGSPDDAARPESSDATSRTAAKSSPRNAFHPDFLRRRQDREDEPMAAVEAENRGPWVVVHRTIRPPVPRDARPWEIYRSWEDPETDPPAAAFEFRELAFLYAAALEVGGRLPGLRLGAEPTEEGGYEVLQTDLDGHDRRVGRIASYDQEVFPAFRNLESLLRSPEALAQVLDAAGSVILRILGRRLVRGA